MTTITKERLQWLANISGRDDIDDIDGGEIRELALIALAALDDSFQDYITTTDMEIEGLAARLAEVNAELQKYKDQFPDYVECANCGSVTHVEGVE